MYQPEFVAVGGSGQNYLAFVDLQELQDNLLNLEENQKVYENIRRYIFNSWSCPCAHRKNKEQL